MTTYAAGRPMVELLRSNDPVLVSFAVALLEDEGIVTVVADSNIAVIEGTIGVFRRRVLVDAERADDARRVLADLEAEHP